MIQIVTQRSQNSGEFLQICKIIFEIRGFIYAVMTAKHDVYSMVKVMICISI